MKIVLPGGSGQVGAVLARAFHARGDEVVVLSRGTSCLARDVRIVPWDGRTLGAWAREVDGADVVVNLAGRTVDCRYSEANLRAMMDSRVDSTRVVGEAIAAAARPPRVWLQSSTATIYAHRFDAPNDERTGILGGSEPGVPPHWARSVAIATRWEETLVAAATPRTRRVALRSSLILSPDRGGIFDTLLGLVRKGLGGTCGNGRQWVSRIHEQDFVRAALFLAERDDLDGAVNVCAPNPVPNRDFMRELRRAFGMPIGLPAPALLLELGAVFLRTETELVLKSRRVVPGRLLAAGFAFEYPEWPAAARELCARARAGRVA
ncbi:MAG: epimerase [Planctomycetota bacterium]